MTRDQVSSNASAIAAIDHAIAVARGDEPADLVIKGGRVINVFSADIYQADVAVSGGHVIGFGSYDGKETLDASGLYVAPGFIDAHIHIESTMLTPREFARAVVPLGTTTVVADPHEIANVLGLDGINYMIEASRGLPLSVFFMLPSCVPATELETAGARLGARELSLLMSHPRVLGLAEVMNYPAVIARDHAVIEKIAAAHGKRIDGHAPGLSGKALNAYVGAGIKSDHECISADEAREKLRAGMHVFLREGSVARNMAALLPAVREANSVRCGLVTDDRHPNDLVSEGHVNFLLERAVSLGLSPLTAIQMVTINAAKYFFTSELGAVAPGYVADLVLLDDLSRFRPRMVFRAGELVAENGRLVAELPAPAPSPRGTVNIRWREPASLEITARGARVKVIEIVPDQLITRKLAVEPLVRDGLVVADPARDIAKLAVIERHRGTGNVGLGFVTGLGLRRGAIASSVAHDSHNVVVAGVSDADMLVAVAAIAQSQGGLVAVCDGEVLASVPLPIAGLMSERPLEEVAAATSRLLAISRKLGCVTRDPFMVLSFLALPVIPALRLTDRGLVDVERFCHVELFGED